MRSHIISSIRGLSLIELMISMVITLLLVLGIVSIYVTSKKGYAVQDDLSRQQENARFSLDILLHDIRMAGYPKSNTAMTGPIVVATTADGGGTANDSITVQYESATDCLGQATPANSCGAAACAINRYYVDNNSNLVCLGNGGPNADVIADSIDSFQILYGVDTDNDLTANKYVKWSSLNATDISNIVSVRLGLLTSTKSESLASVTSTTFQVMDQSITTNDKRFHRLYVNTVKLRNVY